MNRYVDLSIYIRFEEEKKNKQTRQTKNEPIQLRSMRTISLYVEKQVPVRNGGGAHENECQRRRSKQDANEHISRVHSDRCLNQDENKEITRSIEFILER
jgi:hypothetical protein